MVNLPNIKSISVNEQTIIAWMKRVDEEGEHAFLQVIEPVSKFPDFVRSIVRRLKTFFPGLGKEKIAQVLARAGLHIGVTTAPELFTV